jgi:hypothetical protein
MRGKGILSWLIVLVVSTSTFLVLAGCGGWVTGSGKVETREMDFTNFTELDIDSAFEVDITRAEAYRVTITTDDNIFDYINVHQSGKTLHIGLKQPYAYMRTTRKATVTMPALQQLELSGASHAKVSGFIATSPLEMDISGASTLNISDCEAGDTDINVSGASKASGSLKMADGKFEVSGASTLELSGSGKNLSLEISGASTLKLGEFTTAKAVVSVSGASRATINITGRLDAEVSGASTLTYLGNPTLGDIEVTGASTLHGK